MPPPRPGGAAAARPCSSAGSEWPHWAPDMSRLHHPRTAPHAQRGKITLLSTLAVVPVDVGGEVSIAPVAAVSCQPVVDCFPLPEGGGFAAWPRPRRLATLLALAAREDPPWKTRARRGFVGRPAVLRCAGIAGSVAVARSSELRSYVPVVAAVVATVATTGATAASPTRVVCARSRSPALTAIRHFSARWPLAAAMLAQAGRSRQPSMATTLRPCSGRAASSAAASPRNERRGARILHAATAGRCQLPHSHLSHADQQQLAQLSRLGVAALTCHWAPMSRPHRARTAPHAQRSETTLLMAAHRSYGKVLGGSAGRQRQQRAPQHPAPPAASEDLLEDATRRIF